MDARKYASKFVKPEDVRDGPIRTRIVNVLEDERYHRLLLELENGSQLGLSDKNTSVLIKAWGHSTESWIGREVLIEIATYTDWKTGEEKETVRVSAVPPEPAPTQNGGAPAPKPLPPSKATAKKPLEDELDDTVPF